MKLLLFKTTEQSFQSKTMPVYTPLRSQSVLSYSYLPPGRNPNISDLSETQFYFGLDSKI